MLRVDISTDSGETWREAALDKDQGRFSFRAWSHGFTPASKGRQTIMARATNRQRATQTFELIFNPAGYHNDVVQAVTIDFV